jgi:hypothetical protein
MSVRRIVLVLLLALSTAGSAAAQNPPAPPSADDVDLDPNPSQPDFTIVNLPTTARLPRLKSAFRVTHRFRRPLGQDDFASLAEDLFGLDSGASIGLEYRFGLMSGLQAGILRTSDRTIEFFGQYNVLNQRSGAPVGLGVLASIDGTNNFRDSYTPALGMAISRELGDHGAVYVEPVWVHNSNLDDVPGDDNSSFLVGLGARLRVRPTVYLTGEFTPRAGYSPGVHQGSFGIEKRAGGHVFQLNFSNGFGNTIGQLARGGTSNDDWYLGFNISRKFF